MPCGRPQHHRDDHQPATGQNGPSLVACVAGNGSSSSPPGRAGGTYLATALDAHSEVLVKAEPLGRLKPRGSEGQLRWVRRLYRPRVVRRLSAVALSTKLDDVLDPVAFAEVLGARSARVVLLDRRNDVKHAISIIRARRLRDETGDWNRNSVDVQLGPSIVEPEDLAQRLEFLRVRKAASVEYASKLGLPLLHLDYSELLVDPRGTLDRVFEFIGVRPATVAGSTFKMTSDDLRQAVLNFDDLRQLYRERTTSGCSTRCSPSRCQWHRRERCPAT